MRVRLVALAGALALATAASPVLAAQAGQPAAPVVVPAAPAPRAAVAVAVAPTGPTAMVPEPCTPSRVGGYDWANLCRYQKADRQVPQPVRAVFIGDSITEWWLTTAPGIFAGGVVDRGIAGQTSPQILLRFYQDVVRLRPRVVHIMCGTNDVAGNTGPTSPEEYAANVLAMVDLAKANGIAVVLGSVLPAGGFNWRSEMKPAAQIATLNAWLKDLARARGLAYADYYSAMATPEGAMKPGLSSDGVHPNAAGYAVMEPIARAALAEAEKPR
ncbi:MULTISPECIES: SGNH/GDSL hydrolase family protein [unclassified Novosphingobium]|uniref:SGNH/GDSL hydrolase family protein n=1 Tax=unclassified Novosphingobium TaxID=2644732 RepID=UPI0014482A79|nr:MULTISPECIES: SGNH/GDSL hydrolase family protein [unclassified Novosphingobium]NKJ42958.1 lysophospholipase L1-like esterase [Novosphingobium sp. SG720]NMN07327.1 lysophospholipase L1-like esterase [Novosphingobium sp. SG919]NMN89636.1 lysophospholipase L1-like esterase [Novosphingobium sp. SG916]